MTGGGCHAIFSGGGLTRKIGILGGTFNPVHLGHLAAAEEVYDRLKLDRILFIPACLPPHKNDDIPSAVQRMEMIKLAISGNPHFDASDIEIQREGRSFTIDTIVGLRSVHADTDFHFITGLDSFLEIQTWKEWERVLTLCRFVVLSRPGYAFSDLKKIGFFKSMSEDLTALDLRIKTHAILETNGIKACLEHIPLYDISSTDIRKRIQKGRTVKYHLPEAVETYIMSNNLYV